MPQQLQILDLPLYPAGHITTNEFPAINRLHGHLLPRHLVLGQFHLPKRPLADISDKAVLIESTHGSDGSGRLGGGGLAGDANWRRDDRRQGGTMSGAIRLWEGDGKLVIVNSRRHLYCPLLRQSCAPTRSPATSVLGQQAPSGRWNRARSAVEEPLTQAKADTESAESPVVAERPLVGAHAHGTGRSGVSLQCVLEGQLVVVSPAHTEQKKCVELSKDCGEEEYVSC
jgi:hypothetical protein